LSTTKNEASRSVAAPPLFDSKAAVASAPAAAPQPHRVLLAVLGTLVVAYAVLSHYSSTHPDAKGLGAGLTLGPALLIGTVVLWRWTKPLIALLAALTAGAVLWRYWPVVERNYEWGDLAQQCGAYALVGIGFARSLFHCRVPMCEQLAAKMHGSLSPGESVYMRRATLAWTLFYFALAASILILYFVAPLRVWSLFVNFATFALIVVAGLIDHAIRRRLLPRHRGGGILTVIRQALIG